MPEHRVGFSCLCGFEYLAEDADQRFLGSPVLIVQGFQSLFGRNLRPAYPARIISITSSRQCIRA